MANVGSAPSVVPTTTSSHVFARWRSSQITPTTASTSSSVAVSVSDDAGVLPSSG